MKETKQYFFFNAKISYWFVVYKHLVSEETVVSIRQFLMETPGLRDKFTAYDATQKEPFWIFWLEKIRWNRRKSVRSPGGAIEAKRRDKLDGQNGRR